MLISNMIFLVVSLRREAPNTSEQRSRSGLCEGVIRREATETKGLVLYNPPLTKYIRELTEYQILIFGIQPNFELFGEYIRSKPNI